MTLDTKYFNETANTSEKTGLVVWALIKSVVFTAIIMSAGYQLFFGYQSVDIRLYPHIAVVIIVSAVTFIALTYHEYKYPFSKLLDETLIDEIQCAKDMVIALAIGHLVMSTEILLIPVIIPFVIWVGPFPLVPMLVVTYLIKDYFPNEPVKRAFAGCSLGYTLGIILRVVGIAVVVLVDSFGLPFVLAGACVEIASFTWYLYNDAIAWIEENKKYEKKNEVE